MSDNNQHSDELAKPISLNVSKEEIDKIELRSAEVNDLLSRTPKWIIRSGSGYLFFLIILIFVTAAVLRYPQSIEATVEIVSIPELAKIISPKAGRITLLVNDHEQIATEQYIGYLDTESDVNNVRLLVRSLDSLRTSASDDLSLRKKYTLERFPDLGELQMYYNEFVSNIVEWESIIDQKSLEKAKQWKELRKSLDFLSRAIRSWESDVIIKSPIDGEVLLNKQWSNSQYVSLNEEIMSVLPNGTRHLIVLKVPVSKLNEIKIGHSVNIKLEAYPFDQYGILKGKITGMPKFPQGSICELKLSLDNGFISTYNKNIQVWTGMTGRAEIITSDVSLLSRIFNRFR